jgi:hypothetical protein
LPDTSPPNNVIAPFWTDLDMDGTSATDSGAGTWYAGILTDGVSHFIILEWQGAELFGVPGVPFTFQIWIEAGTSNIWYVYAEIPGIPSFLTVGAENDDGLNGTNYYFDGTGTPPAVGEDLKIGFTAAGVATFTFQVEAGPRADPFVNVAEATSGGLTVKSRSPAVFVDYRTTTLCSDLGIDGWRPDRDFFKFEGIEGETITLRMDPDGVGNGRATLAVWGSHGSHFFKMERGNLPHEIVATLPKTGTYWIMVEEHHRRWKHGGSFRGPYCLSLKSAKSDTLEPGYMVE